MSDDQNSQHPPAAGAPSVNPGPGLPPGSSPKPGDKDLNSFWANMPSGIRIYFIYCALIFCAMAYANHVGYFPTYGIFAGENSLHSSGYHGFGYYGGGRGIHGK